MTSSCQNSGSVDGVQQTPSVGGENVIAQGSEKFSWKLFPGAERVCRECGRKLKIDDVRENRTLYPSHKMDFWCKDCHARWLDERSQARKAHQGP